MNSKAKAMLENLINYVILDQDSRFELNEREKEQICRNEENRDEAIDVIKRYIESL